MVKPAGSFWAVDVEEMPGGDGSGLGAAAITAGWSTREC